MKEESNATITLPPISSNVTAGFRSPSAKGTIYIQAKEKKTLEKISNKKNLIPIQPNIKLIPTEKNNEKEKETIQKENEETKSYIEDMKKGSYNILVCVRCRPLSSLECQLSSYETIRIMDNKMVVLLDPIEYNGPNSVFKNRSREQTYAFDFAFDKNTSQNCVFENSTKFLIKGVVNGYNATVFAYGATGAGKTYTMLGNENNPGIMPLTLQELFNEVNSLTDREYKLRFWYLEIYNENIRDLLKFMNKNNQNDDNEYLDLREDPIKGILVSGITEISITNSKEMLKILKRGNRNRTQEATGANETSSRSHAILQVSIEYKEKNSGIDIEIKYSKLSLIDLAGSERASATQNRGIRLIEGANINRSLLTLGNCINALCDASAKGIKKPYVPYRDSKLTRLLKDSLGGNARTVMIANVSPSINTFDDTYNTLKYANRAKNIKTVVTRNVLNAQYHISNYVNIINNLKSEVALLKQQLQIQNKNNINAKTIDVESDVKNKLSDDVFEKSRVEIKNACNNQINSKQKIISANYEINKLSDLIEMSGNILSINNDLSQLINNNEEQQNNNENNNENKIKILNEKMDNLKKSLALNKKKFDECSNLIEKYLNNLNNNNFNELQKEHLNLMIKNTNHKIQLIDFKNDLNLYKAKNDLKDGYIKELENQIKYRDEIFQEKNINIFTTENTKIKNLETLKNEYSQKKSRIKITSCSKNNLPPISWNKSSSNNFAGTNPKNLIRDSKKILSKNSSNSRIISSKNNYKTNNVFTRPGSIKNSARPGIINPSTKNNTKKSNRYSSVNKNFNIMQRNKSLIYNYYNYKDVDIRQGSSKGRKIRPPDIEVISRQKQNNSFCQDSHFGLLGDGENTGMVTTEQVPQIKKSDLNNMLNERNKRRQKFLDKINSDDKDLL